MTTSRTTRHRRAGFSLVELIITLLLVAIIGAAAGRLLMSQTRFYSRLAGQKDARSVTRSARNIIQTELSMVEAGGGVVAASNDSIRVRMPYAWGVYCTNDKVAMLPVDSAMYAMATYAGYAIKDTTSIGIFAYYPGPSAPNPVGSGDCNNNPTYISAPTGGQYLQLSPSPTATTGSPMFLYQIVTYQFAASAMVPGTRGLYRRVADGAAEETLAPFDTSAKFRFYNMYSDTAQTVVPLPAAIRGVELQLDAQSANRTGGRSVPESVRIKTAVFFRNRVD